MGSFVLTPADYAPARIRELIAEHDRHGLGLTGMLEAGGFRAHIFDSLTKPSICLSGDDGPDAAVVGNLVYKGFDGEAALQHYLADHADGSLDPARIIGHFAVLAAGPDGIRVEADPMGIFHLFVSADGAIAASSFWAMLRLLPGCQADPDGIYEYAWNGATFGAKTFVRQIRKAGPQAALVTGAGRIAEEERPAPALGEAATGLASLDDYARHHLDHLRAVFADLAGLYGDRLRISLSGGFDSRLLLALALEQGCRPSLFVYGRQGQRETEIARAIAEGEGLALDIVDKSTMVAPDPDPDRFAEWMARDAVIFDGWKNDGLFGNGADYHDRISRHRDDRVPLNGGLGEIYRNFFYLPDRSWPVPKLIDAFFSRYAPAAVTGAFDPARYRQGIADVIAARTGAHGGRLTRAQVEQVYPLLRGRDWTAREVNINHRIGRMFFPFIYWQTIRGTCDIPVACKTFGRLEGRMIALVNARLAAYPSNYGFDFNAGPSLSYRLKHQSSLRRPTLLRRLSYRLKWRRPVPLPDYLGEDYLGRCIDTAYPHMGRYFHMDRLHEPDARNRVATMEYLFQTFDVQPPA